jgi:hypothetical protein
MSENLLDDFFKDKLQNFSLPIPQGAWDKIVENNTIDNFIKNKLQDYSSAIPENTFSKIFEKNTFESFVQNKFANATFTVPEQTWQKILKKRTLDNFIKDKLSEYASPLPEHIWDKIFAYKETDLLFKERLGNYSSSVPKNLWNKIVASMPKTLTGSWFIRNVTLWVASLFIGLLLTTFITLKEDEQKNILVSNVNLSGSIKNSQATEINEGLVSKNKSIPSNRVTGNLLNNKTNRQLPSAINNNVTNVQPLFPNAFNNNFSIIPNRKDSILAANESVTIMNNKGETYMNEESANKNILPAELYSLKNLQQLNQLKNQYTFSANKSPDILPCPNEKPIDWFVEGYMSPDYSNKVISNTSGLSSSFISLKDSAESMRVGFSVGVRITKRVGNHLLLKGGLQYAQINEQLALRTENERKTTTVIISRTIVRPQGDTTISDTSSVTQIGYRVTKNTNRYKSVEIPLSVGYEFGAPKDKWKFAVNGGVVLNINSSFTGYTLDTSLTVIAASSKGTDAYYKTKVGMSLFGSVSVIRNINERTDVFAEPYFKYGLSGTTSTVGFTQKFNTLGIQAGIRVKLNYVKHHY